MKVRHIIPGLLLANPLLGCALLNTAMIIGHDSELAELSGELFVVNCRHMEALPSVRLFLSNEGVDLELDLNNLGADSSLRPEASPEFYIIPTPVEWAPLRRLASRPGRDEPLSWKCGARLCRKGLSKDHDGIVTFNAVSDGDYDFFLLSSVRDPIAEDRPAVETCQHSSVTIVNGIATIHGEFASVPEDRKGLHELRSQL